MSKKLMLVFSISWMNFLTSTSGEHIDSSSIMTTTDMIKLEGYPVEEHTILTDDGYLLTLHRIPGGAKAQTVFLQHGVLASSFNWVLPGKEKGLAFILSDHGYDVWIGNCRGNTYSRRHINYTSSERKFWDFSWHEMGVYDLPAVITYITTLRNSSLIYIGHSMGTTMFYVMAIERPDIAANVKVMFSIAPVAFMNNWNNSARFLSRFMRPIETIFDRLGLFEILSQSKLFKYLQRYGCNIFPSHEYVCAKSLASILGYDSPHFNYELLPRIMNHMVTGTSTKTLLHYLQLVNSKKFQHYDYGIPRNLKIYNTSKPPAYNISQIQVPIGLFWSDYDYLAHPQDVQALYRLIPKTILNYKIPASKFSHTDYLYGIDAPKLVYAKLLQVMKTYK